jgi:PIN domain nuclease of toxin-antitoxin system
VRLLIDTHVLLWTLADSPRIATLASRLLDPDNAVYFSVASLWEIAIKAGIGKLAADVAEVRLTAIADGFLELPVLGHHVTRLKALPDLHKDPFDRLLVAQAVAEPMLLLTADAKLAAYGAAVELI